MLIGAVFPAEISFSHYKSKAGHKSENYKIPATIYEVVVSVLGKNSEIKKDIA